MAGALKLRILVLASVLLASSVGGADAPTDDSALEPVVDRTLSKAAFPNLTIPSVDAPMTPSPIVPKVPQASAKAVAPAKASPIRSVAPGNGEVVTRIYNKPPVTTSGRNSTGLLIPSGDQFEFLESSETPEPAPKTPVVRPVVEPLPPQRPTSPATVGLPVPPKAPRPFPQLEEPDDKAEGRVSLCPNGGRCPLDKKSAGRLDKLPVTKVAGAEPQKGPAKEPTFRAPGTVEACYGRALLNSAKALQRQVVGGHDPRRSHGACAFAVHEFLAQTGFTGPGYDGHFGNAIDYFKRPGQSIGNLRKMGFKNIMSQGYNESNAPPGAVLVFRGPFTNETDGRIGHAGSAGDYVGHVTVKGDTPHSYYTDGHTYDPHVRNRYLVGVYVMSQCKTCTAKLKQKCGG